MKRIITGTFEAAIGLTFALMVLGGLAGGFIVFPPFGACLGGLAAFFFGSLMFGALYILIEIRDLLRGQSSRSQSSPSSQIAPVSYSSAPPLSTPTTAPAHRSKGQCLYCGYGNAASATTCANCGNAI